MLVKGYHLCDPLRFSPPDAALVWITPPEAIEFLQGAYSDNKRISPRMLSHWVQVTIGEAAKPASGPGSRRGFSIKDIAVMSEGLKLSFGLGLHPHKVRRCCDAILSAWDGLLFPEPYSAFFRLGRNIWQEVFHRQTYLVAAAPEDGFIAMVVPQEMMFNPTDDPVGMHGPCVVANVSTPITATVVALAEYWDAHAKDGR